MANESKYPCHQQSDQTKWCDYDKTVGKVHGGGFMGHTCIRKTYPVPDGYRMLQPGEIIKENDLCWFADKWQQVPHTADYTGAADPERHPCIIRAHSSYLYGHGQPAEEKRADQIRPNYYKQGGIEVIGIIRAFKLGFNLGNVIKYVLRAGLKSENRLEDLQKANTYLQFELTEEKQKDGSPHVDI
jgi:hypothetical protein